MNKRYFAPLALIIVIGIGIKKAIRKYEEIIKLNSASDVVYNNIIIIWRI